MNKILCPVDFSDNSLNAIEFAVEVGKKFHSKISLLHVFTEKDFNNVIGERAKGKSFKELLAMAKGKLEALADSINAEHINHEDKGIDKCDYFLELGELVPKVNEIANEQHFDLIVVGTTGVSRTNGIFIGSNTEDIIAKVKKPILCVPEAASFSNFQKIVYGSDYLDKDKIAMQQVVSFATMFDARINVLHVNLNDTDHEYDKFTEELKSFVQYKKISFVHQKYDDVGSGLNSYMYQENADLLVVFKRERSFVQSIFSKSLTQVLSHTITKPLLVLKL